MCRVRSPLLKNNISLFESVASRNEASSSLVFIVPGLEV